MFYFDPLPSWGSVRTRNTPSLYAYYVECETLNLLDNTERKKVNFIRNQASIWNLQIIILLSWHALCRAKTILQERQTLFGASLGFLTCKWFLLLSWHACHKGYPLGTTTQLPAVGWGSVAQGLLWLLCVCVYIYGTKLPTALYVSAVSVGDVVTVSARQIGFCPVVM